MQHVFRKFTVKFNQEYLRSIIDYNPITGICKWRKRPRTDFRYARDHKAWNKKHTGNQITSINPSNGKIIVGLFQRAWNLDQLIWVMVLNEEPPIVYHANGCNVDNRWDNLTTTPQKCTRYAGGDLCIIKTEFDTYAVCAKFHIFNIFEDIKEAKTFMLELAEKLQTGWETPDESTL